MRILCVDYGKARIGCAISDPTGILATPIGTIHEKNFRIQLEKLEDVIKNNNADKILFGLPKNMDGSEGESALLVREFAEKISVKTGLDYEFIDERLSTVSAHRALNEVDMSGSRKRKQVVDTLSAVILLQAYLDK
jgi:putative Holliday junction resolvase